VTAPGRIEVTVEGAKAELAVPEWFRGAEGGEDG